MQTQLVGRTSPTRLKPRTLDLPPNSLTLHWSCTRWSTRDSSAMLTHWRDKSISLDFNFTLMDLFGVFGGSPRATPIKSTLVILKSNSASATLDFKITSVDLRLSRWSPTPNNIGFQFKSQIWDLIGSTERNENEKKERWDWLLAYLWILQRMVISKASMRAPLHSLLP